MDMFQFEESASRSIFSSALKLSNAVGDVWLEYFIRSGAALTRES